MTAPSELIRVVLFVRPIRVRRKKAWVWSDKTFSPPARRFFGEAEHRYLAFQLASHFRPVGPLFRRSARLSGGAA